MCKCVTSWGGSTVAQSVETWLGNRSTAEVPHHSTTSATYMSVGPVCVRVCWTVLAKKLNFPKGINEVILLRHLTGFSNVQLGNLRTELIILSSREKSVTVFEAQIISASVWLRGSA